MRDTIVNETEKTETLVKLEVYDGSSWISFGNDAKNDRLYSISLDNSIDSSSWTLEARFRNHPDAGDSLDPYPAGTFQNLLAQYNKCHLDISKDGGSHWYRMFEGYSSETSPEHKVDKDDTVIYRPIDPSKRLKDRIIPWDLTGWDSELSYRNVDAFDAVDDILSAAGFSETMNRNISDDPQKTIYGNKPYEPRGMTVWSAIQIIFEETGYNVAYRFDDDNDPATLDLAVIDPSHDLVISGRADSSDWNETWIDNNFRIFDGNFDRRELTVDDKDVRTKVTVWYQGEDGQQKVSVQSDDSPNAIPAGGSSLHREQIMTEPDDSLIDKKVEALNLAQITLGDLRALSPDVAFDFPFFYPSAQLTDVYRMGGAGDYTVDLFVTDISHTIDVGRKIGTTTLSGAADRVIGKRDYWLNKDLDDDEDIRQRGDGRPPNPPQNAPRIEKSIYQVESSGETRADIIAIGELAPEFDIIYYKWKYRIYNGTNWSGWQDAGTTGAEHPETTIGGLAVGSDRKMQIKYAPMDRQSQQSGGTAPWSPSQEILLTGDTTPPGLPTSVSTKEGPERVVVTWTNPIIDGNGSSGVPDLSDVVVYVKAGSDPTKSDYLERKEAGKSEKWIYDSENTSTTYHFRLSAEDNSGNESGLTDPETGSPAQASVADGYAPSKPSWATTPLVDRFEVQEDGTVIGSLKVDWSDVTTNQNSDTTDDIQGYEVAICNDDDNACTITNGAFDTEANWDIVSTTESSDILITGLDVNTTYAVSVRTFDFEDKYSDWISPESEKVEGDTTPPTWSDTNAVWVSINEKIATLELSWNPADTKANDLKEYEIEYATSTDGGSTWSAWGGLVSLASTSYSVVTQNYDLDYKFRIQAIDNTGNQSKNTQGWIESTSSQSGLSNDKWGPSMIQSADTLLGIGEWTYEGKFSAVDHETIKWIGSNPGSGTGYLTLPDSTQYEISDNTSYTLSGFEYIYFDRSGKSPGGGPYIFSKTSSATTALGPDSTIVAAAQIAGGASSPDTSALAPFDVYSGSDELGFQPYVITDYIATGAITIGELHNSVQFSYKNTAGDAGDAWSDWASGTSADHTQKSASDTGYSDDDILNGTYVALCESSEDSESNLPQSGDFTDDIAGFEIPEDIASNFWNRVIRVDIWAKEPPSDASIEFAVNYSTTSNGSNWTYFNTPATWTKFHLIYPVPNDDSSGKDYLRIWGDTAGNGKGILVDDISISLMGADEWVSGENYTQIDGGKIYAGSSITIGSGGAGYIKSSNYNSGVDGWKINGSGDAELNNITARGKIILKAGSDAGWSFISGSAKPEDNATIGADWSTNLTGIPNRHINSATSGLNLTSSHLGFYDGSNWTAFIDNTGLAEFKNDLIVGDTASSPPNYMQYDVSTGTLTVRGDIKTDKITADTVCIGKSCDTKFVDLDGISVRQGSAPDALQLAMLGELGSTRGFWLYDDTGTPLMKAADDGKFYMQSPNFNGNHNDIDTSPGDTGWAINQHGNAVFNNITASGDIEIDGSLSGSDITNTLSITGDIQSNNYGASTGWKIDGSTNSAVFNDVEVRGDIYVTSTDSIQITDTDGSTIFDGNSQFQGYRVIDAGVIGSDDSGQTDDATVNFTHTPINWYSHSNDVPPGKQWVTRVTIAPQDDATPGFQSSYNKFGDTWGFTLFLSGSFKDESDGSFIGGVLTSGDASNVKLEIYSLMSIEAGIASNDIYAEAQVFWEVVEIPA